MSINYQKIYEQLGNLFYSVAASDNQAFASCCEMYKSHFSKELKRKITVTATEIANAFVGSNKSELTNIIRLNLLLQ